MGPVRPTGPYWGPKRTPETGFLLLFILVALFHEGAQGAALGSGSLFSCLSLSQHPLLLLCQALPGRIMGPQVVIWERDGRKSWASFHQDADEGLLDKWGGNSKDIEQKRDLRYRDSLNYPLPQPTGTIWAVMLGFKAQARVGACLQRSW